jgi:hypothetical protein
MTNDKAAEIKNLVEAWVFRLNGAVSELRDLGVSLDLSVSGNTLSAKLGEAKAPAPVDMKAKPKANG